VRIQLRNLLIADAEVFEFTEGSIWRTVMRGSTKPPESLALGTLSKGFSRNLGKPHSLLWEKQR